MQKHSDILQDDAGNVVGGVPVLVQSYPAGLPVIIYTDNDPSPSKVIPNSIINTNADGSFSFYGPNGHYQTTAYGDKLTVAIVKKDILLQDLAPSSGSADVGYIQSGTGAVARTMQDKARESVSALDFMTAAQIADVIANTAALDVTVAIQAAINAVSASGGKVLFPRGTYKVTSAITIVADKVFLQGDGQGSTNINFAPTASGVCLLVDKGSAICFQGGIAGFSFFSNDTTYTKTAIKLIDTSGYIVKECGTNNPHWLGNNSIFLQINGRELGSVHDIYAEANRPLVVGPIPSPHTAGGIGIDHFNFHNIYFIAVGNPVVEFLTGLLLAQCSFTGHQAWVGGTYGLYWNDTTSAAISNGLDLENVRFEQGSDPTKWLVYIAHNYKLQGLKISGGQGGDRNGFYLRKVDNFNVDSFYYTSTTLVALDADTTVSDFGCVNCFWQTGSTTNIVGHDLVFSGPVAVSAGPIAPTAFYCLTSNVKPMTAGRTYTPTVTRNVFTEVLGGGSITTTGTYILIGKMCFFVIKTVCAGGATIASTSNTSYFSGLPTAAVEGLAGAVRSDNSLGLGEGLVSSTVVLPPSWPAVANASYIVSGHYLTV